MSEREKQRQRDRERNREKESVYFQISTTTTALITPRDTLKRSRHKFYDSNSEIRHEILKVDDRRVVSEICPCLSIYALLSFFV